MTSQQYGAPAVDKAIDVIEYLAKQRRPRSISDIATGLERSVSEIYRVVLALERRQVLFKDPFDEKYTLSLTLLGVVNRFPPVDRIVSISVDELDALCGRTLQSCHLTMIQGSRLYVVASFRGPLPMGFNVATGSSFDVVQSTSGRTILAFSPEQAVAPFLAGQSEADQATLRNALQEVRTRGHSIENSRTVSGLVNISVPILDRQGEALAGVTIPFLKQQDVRLDAEGCMLQLKECAERIRMRLG